MRTALALGLAALVLSGCGGDKTSDYCETVSEHQVELSDLAASSEPGAIFDTLGPYRELRDDAPRDLRDEWSQVIGRLEALEKALEEAGVDAAAYDPKTTQESLTPAQRTAVQGAARDLGDAGVVAAMTGVEQHALDVCKMPLSR